MIPEQTIELSKLAREFDASGSYSRSLTASVIAFGAGAFALLAQGRYPPELGRAGR